ncbi:L-threonylcarbamoyladenylate synthase [Vagococcus humatus]|uniref:Threonylcarbamoyl-AMP synthase n=1 Tax=Vagococcus humatus TaxID=1889241 RepID=A0A3R9YBZ7_9ENTE|nr:L-threonylcarbamoyladenylate synthase [Vagococcus humatus]RST88831.1 threonylcarbamoyl-AMP synthase [Vagococcus humatus]
METKILKPSELAEAVSMLEQGGLVSFPTETVYGLGADAMQETAVKRVYQAKGRPSDNPLIVHVASIDEIKQYVENFPEKAQQLGEKFWPGPLTMIFPIKEGIFSTAVTGGLSTVAFRIPNNIETIRLINQFGHPLVGPSANTSGKPSPTTAEHVYHDLNGKIEGILDGGATTVGIESTVVDMTGELPMILRPGAITLEQLSEVVGTVLVDKHLVAEEETPKAPGMKYKHYSPNTPVYMIDWQKNNWQAAIDWAKATGQQYGLLANQEIIDQYGADAYACHTLSEKRNVSAAMTQLFAGLRALDESGLDSTVIFSETYPENGQGIAFMNRLKKASGQKYFDEKNL